MNLFKIRSELTSSLLFLEAAGEVFGRPSYIRHEHTYSYASWEIHR